ncbi:hypothetical protein C0J52_05561 [Blattella germanica]|nr:hypothetical protein C0J52_05561 [Blattella germanica]
MPVWVYLIVGVFLCDRCFLKVLLVLYAMLYLSFLKDDAILGVFELWYVSVMYLFLLECCGCVFVFVCVILFSMVFIASGGYPFSCAMYLMVFSSLL